MTKVVGGAKAEKVTIETPEGTPPEDADIEVVTTAIGTMGPLGLVPVGYKMKVTFSQYSENWMRPANGNAVKKLKQHQKEEPSEQSS